MVKRRSKSFKAVFCAILFHIGGLSNATDPLADIPVSCRHTLSERSGNFKSTNYPSNYPSNHKCGWILEATGNNADIQVTFHDFELESSKRCSAYDHVFIYTQAVGSNTWSKMTPLYGYCGRQTIPPRFEICKRMLVKFSSDAVREFKGFNATYTITVTQDASSITWNAKNFANVVVSGFHERSICLDCVCIFWVYD